MRELRLERLELRDLRLETCEKREMIELRLEMMRARI